MRPVLIRIIMAVIVIGVAGCVTGGQTVPSDLAAAEVERVDHARLDAILKSDFDAVEKFLADDVIVTLSNGAVLNKAEYLDRQRSGQRRLTSAIQDDVRVRVYGDAAVITGRSTGKLMVDGPPRAAAQLAIATAEAVDRKVEALPADLVAANAAAGNPLNLIRVEHRCEHLDEIERVLTG